MKGDQLTAEYQHICPNKKVPAIAFVGVPVSTNDTVVLFRVFECQHQPEFAENLHIVLSSH